ncbi:MAG: glycosyltransferase [Leptospirales bacterium]|nr:glycosyltransferase [Leptospirales bacterium]
MPFFSIVIPTYNRYNQLRAALDSALAQTFKDYELIVIDDGSTDETRLIEDIYGDKIRFIRQKNCGVSAARNAGILAGDSGHIAFLDSDDVWLPAKLERQFAFIKENPGIGLSQTNEVWMRNGRRVNPKLKHLKRAGDIFIDSLALCLISPSAAVLKREITFEYGLFDENLPACEDYDLWLRILAHEKAGLLDENLVVRYSGHWGQLSQKYWGMDSFRLYSIIKLLHGDKRLKPAYREEAAKSAIERCSLLIAGAQKRNKPYYAAHLQEILTQLSREDYNNINCQILLEK